MVSLLVLLFSAQVATTAPPNILLIVADDLGFSDLGCYGGEIATPHLDRLARQGERFSQFYNTARCWPSRAAILTGYYPQQVRRDTVPGVRSGGGGQRPPWAKLLPELLQSAGYRSYHSGKWHLDGMPIAQGFDHSYYLKDQGRFFHPKVHHRDDRPLPPVAPGTDYYGTIAIADHAIACLQEHAREFSEKPFFHYLAFTAPHFPLHALPQDFARYADRYHAGWEVIRQERWERQRGSDWLNVTRLSPPERHLGPPYHFPEALAILGPDEVNRPLPWDTLTESQRRFQANKMALHAAMVARMDREIGRVLDQLTEMKAMNNTLIAFLSDNGASAEIMVRDDGHDPQAPPGSAATYLCLGPGWSTTCNTPFRRHKTWVHEGGIATPFILHWPGGPKISPEQRRRPAHVIDLVPTILNLAGLTAKTEGPPRPGKDFLAPANPSDPPRTLWWQHEWNRALRQGQWKIVAPEGEPWELYDLQRDRAETLDLAESEPDRLRALTERWETLWQSFQEIARDAP